MPVIPIRNGLPSTAAPSAPTAPFDRFRYGTFIAPDAGLFTMRHSRSLPASGVPAAVAPAPAVLSRLLPRVPAPAPTALAARVTPQPVARQAPSEPEPELAGSMYPRTLLGA